MNRIRSLSMVTITITAATAVIWHFWNQPASDNYTYRVVRTPNISTALLSYYPMPSGQFSLNEQARAGSLPGLDEEVWVIHRSGRKQATTAKPSEQTPDSGTLKARLNDLDIAFPLKHTEVKAVISGHIGTVEVTQQFQNPYDDKIEAVYVFPLPHNAAVNEFLMTIGERKIRGIIRDRQEAERIYEEARQQGYVASLLTQERPNVFTQKVANIEPGKAIDINIKYFHTLACHEGRYEFVFPMVVGPRFTPPGSTTGIGAVARDAQGSSQQQTEVAYLRPGERSGHDINLSVTIDAGVNIEQIKSHNHAVTVERPNAHQAEVTLCPLDRIPNKDFVLRYKLTGDHIKSAMLTHRDQRGGYFTLMVYPPENMNTLKRKPLEMVFLLDCSGSMSGQPLAQSKNAMNRALRRLQQEDSFQIIRFSNSTSQLSLKPLEATAANVARGLAYVHNLEGEGGTVAIKGVKAALNYPHDPARLRFVCLMTDGFVDNETEILNATREQLGISRIFSFGVGSSPNRFFLEGMAKIGRGAIAYLSLNESGSQIMDYFFDRISHPAVTDLEIDWGGMQVTDQYPASIPDLFVDRPVIITGRFAGSGSTTVRIRGQAAGEPCTITVPVNLDDQTARHVGLPAIWARMKIADLSDDATNEQSDSQVKSLALEYSLMSAYTSFVAVDSLTRTAGDHGTTATVSVPVPEGVRFETAVPHK